MIQVGTAELPRKGIVSQATSPTRLGIQDAQDKLPDAAGGAMAGGPTLHVRDNGGQAAGGPTLHVNDDVNRPQGGLGVPGNATGDRTPDEYLPLPGEGIVSRFLSNLPPPPQENNIPGISPAPPAAGGSMALGDQPRGPTLAQPSNNSEPTAPQFPEGHVGAGGGEFRIPPDFGAANPSNVPEPNGAGGGAFGGGGFPVGNDQAVQGDETQKPRPIQPPTLYQSTPEPITDPDASKAGKKESDNIAEGNSPSDRVGRLAANLSLRNDTASQKPTIDEETARELAEAESAKPWLPLVLTSFALFASLAANMYLGWIAIGIYRRYRSVVGQLHQARTAPA